MGLLVGSVAASTSLQLLEHGVERVGGALERYNLSYPVGLDNDCESWDAYHVHYGSSKSLVDPYGRIQYGWAGEGGCEGTGDEIRHLLRQANDTVPEKRAEVDERTGGWTGQQTPELFVAPIDEQTKSAIGNEEGSRTGATIDDELPIEIREDRVYLSGPWYSGDESVIARSGNASGVLDSRAGATNTVAGGPGECLGVRLDGRPINGSLAARDVAFVEQAPCVRVDGKRSYDVYAGPVDRRVLRLEVPAGFELDTFAFGETGRE